MTHLAGAAEAALVEAYRELARRDPQGAALVEKIAWAVLSSLEDPGEKLSPQSLTQLMPGDNYSPCSPIPAPS